MKAVVFFNHLVAKTLHANGCDESEAARLTARAHPDAAKLARAAGATGQQVQFFNAGQARHQALPDRVSAREEFRKLVSDKMQSSGLDYDRSYQSMASIHPDLYQRMNGTPTPVFANAVPTAPDGTVPARGPKNATLLCLPASITQQEFEAAWIANGRTLAPLNPGKVMDALVQFRMGRAGIAREAAVTSCKRDFPMLWDQVEALAKSVA